MVVDTGGQLEAAGAGDAARGVHQSGAEVRRVCRHRAIVKIERQLRRRRQRKVNDSQCYDGAGDVIVGAGRSHLVGAPGSRSLDVGNH